MSKIIKSLSGRLLGDIVQTDDGASYYIDSAYTYDHGYETMAFLYDPESSQVVNWCGAYTKWYGSEAEMIERHKYICEHFEEVLKSE